MSNRYPRSHELPLVKRLRLYAAGAQACQNWDDVTELMEAFDIAMRALLGMIYTDKGVDAWMKQHRDLQPVEKVNKATDLFGQVAT